MFTYNQNCPIIFGPGAVDHLGEYVSDLGNIKKALCIFDPGVEKAGIPARAMASLEKAGIACVPFGDIGSEPTTDIVDAAGALGRLLYTAVRAARLVGADPEKALHDRCEEVIALARETQTETE